MMLAALAASLTAAPLVTALAVHRFGARRHAPPSRAMTAVVLGARVLPDGTMSDALVDRVRAGAALVREGRARRLIFSGGSPDARPTEASVMAAFALELGVPADAITVEAASRSTFENAARCAPLLSDAGESELLLVTCDFHLARATAHFRAHRLTVWPVASARHLGAADRLMVTARETIALLARPRLILSLAGVPLPPR